MSESARRLESNPKRASERYEQILADKGLTVLWSDADINEVTQFDRRLYKGFFALSEDHFRAVIESGGVIIGHRKNDYLISEATLYLNAYADGLSVLERELPAWAGLCDGAAVDPEYRGKGMQAQLLEAREEIARIHHKDGLIACVRQRNLPSIRNLLNAGFCMLVDAPQFYGTGPTDDRIIAVKLFESPSLYAHNFALEEITPLADTRNAIVNQELVSFAIQASDEADTHYNYSVGQLLTHGYAGMSCQDVSPGDPDRTCLMTFIRIDPASQLARIQHELQEICLPKIRQFN